MCEWAVIINKEICPSTADNSVMKDGYHRVINRPLQTTVYSGVDLLCRSTGSCDWLTEQRPFVRMNKDIEIDHRTV